MAREAFHPRPCETHAESHEFVSKPPNHRAAITHPPLHHPSFGHGTNTRPINATPVPPACSSMSPWPALAQTGVSSNPSSNPPSLTPFPRAPELDPLRLSNGVSLRMAQVWSPLLLSRRNPRLGRRQKHTNGSLVSAQHGIRPSHVSFSFAPPTIRMSPLLGSPFTPPPTLPARPSSCRSWGRWISIKQPPRIPIFAVFLPLPYPSHSSLIFTYNPLNPLGNLAAVCNSLAAAALIPLLRVLSVVHCKKSAPFRHPR
ncbi:hypothetical protein BKA56DRAFT_125637 [Ilyonectria sp. MPI-CAGE-AT-0026]|nr:hypothetical protein BKA56DRAFT_125637 [Ilyonectria sp. MPI-CAGE-AT-0026]